MEFIMGVTISILIGWISPPIDKMITNKPKIYKECRGNQAHPCTRLRINQFKEEVK